MNGRGRTHFRQGREFISHRRAGACSRRGAKRPLASHSRGRGTTKWWRGRWRSPRANHFRTHSRLRTNFGSCTFFFTQKKKVPKKKCASLRLDRLCRKRQSTPLPLPTKKIPTSPHAMAFGSNGVPQKDYGFPQSQIFPHRVRTAEPEPYHAPRAPRAVWAQTGLVRGSLSL